MAHNPESPDDPYRSCTTTVEGDVASELVDIAIERAAVFLGEPRENLYAAHVGNAVPAEESPYRKHLAVSPTVIRWRATVTVRLRPDIVRERREAAELARDPDAPDRPRPDRPLKLV